MLRAIIFDFDGVIADSERAHFEAFRRVLEAEGIFLDWRAYTESYLAMDDRRCFTTALTRQGRVATPEVVTALSRQKAEVFQTLTRDGLVLMPGVVDLVPRAAARYPLAMASGALRREIVPVLEGAKLDRFFRVIVSAEEVTHGKPAPEAFQTALARLNAESGRPGGPIREAECLVIEDSVHGIEGAHRAGMKCLAVATSYPLAALKQADLVVKNLAEVDLDRLPALFQREG